MAQHSSCTCSLLPCRCAHLWMDQTAFVPAQQPVYVDFTNPFYYLPDPAQQSYCWQLPAYPTQAASPAVTPPVSPYPMADFANCPTPQPLQQYMVLPAAQQQQAFAVPSVACPSQAVWMEEANKENEPPSHQAWNEDNSIGIQTRESQNLARHQNAFVLPSSRGLTTPYSRGQDSLTARAKKRQSPLAKDVAKRCSNCGVTESSLWRRTDEGHVECNPCQLHFRRYGKKRPLELRNEKIHRRTRKPRQFQ